MQSMREALENVLQSIARPAIAVSGGVDSVTLAAAAALVTSDLIVFHAVSPAVPKEATARVRRLAADRGWPLIVAEAGEFGDPLYRANPVDRCFHCKTHLYGAIRARTERQILSGANLDDLGEYRPGLEAARRHGVRHPYVEAGINKLGVRQIARSLGLDEVAELPSSPCLSSRVETGIPIEMETLGFIHDVERLLAAELMPLTVRCRVRAAAVVVELDELTLDALTARQMTRLTELIGHRPHRPSHLPIRFEPYRNGSAFLVGHTK
jgi:uncharacterized protein